MNNTFMIYSFICIYSHHYGGSETFMLYQSECPMCNCVHSVILQASIALLWPHLCHAILWKQYDYRDEVDRWNIQTKQQAMGKSSQEETRKLTVRNFVHSYTSMKGFWGVKLQFKMFPTQNINFPFQLDLVILWQFKHPQQ